MRVLKGPMSYFWNFYWLANDDLDFQGHFKNVRSDKYVLTIKTWHFKSIVMAVIKDK